MTQVNAMLGVASVARRLGMSPDAVRKAIKRGNLPATLVTLTGRERAIYLVDEREVQRYQQQHRRPGHRVAAP